MKTDTANALREILGAGKLKEKEEGGKRFTTFEAGTPPDIPKLLEYAKQKIQAYGKDKFEIYGQETYPTWGWISYHDKMDATDQCDVRLGIGSYEHEVPLDEPDEKGYDTAFVKDKYHDWVVHYDTMCRDADSIHEAWPFDTHDEGVQVIDNLYQVKAIP
jgi:hypothetical protein